MKNLFAIALLSLITSIGHAQQFEIVSIQNLSEKLTQEISKGEHPEIAIEFEGHSILPLKLFLKGDLIQLIDQKQAISLEFQQTFYVRFVENNFLLSTDLQEWKTISEFVTGNISFSFGADNYQPCASLGAEVKINNHF